MTSDDYRPCVAIYPDGKVRRSAVRHIRLVTVEQALADLAQDHATYVAPGDAEAVLIQMRKRHD